ncbi:MAG: TonB-dependent receptor [Bacteroidales bacterium]
MKTSRNLFLLTLLSLFCFVKVVKAQQINAFISGTVVGATDNEQLVGAHILVTHVPTGTKYHAVTNAKGMYRIANVQPGGPYSIKIAYIGYNDDEMSDIQLNLGETTDFVHKMDESAHQLGDVVITANKSGQFQENKMGMQTTVTSHKLAVMPNAGRSVGDFVRFSPQVKVSPSGAISVAGQNNRYNSFTVDGAPQNDTYGLADNGTNSGQIGFTPFSMDVIDQISVQISPYDVKQSGFSGAGISASTKSGTNEFKVSFYDYFRNQALAGKTPTDNPNTVREKLSDFTSNTTGLSISGPIIKDKVFFFVNGEYQIDNSPREFDYNRYNPDGATVGKASRDDLQALRDKMINQYGYDPGTFGNITNDLTGGRLFAKIDWNINSDNKFTLRYNFTTGQKLSPGVSSADRIIFSNNGQDFSSTVHTVGGELKTKISDEMSNYLFIGYNRTVDDRNPTGQNFPSISIGRENIALGSEEYSTANKLSQNILTIENNLEIYKGSHTITIGTHNEFFNIYNLFMANNFGRYTYNNLEQFMSDAPASQYDRTFSNVDNITGDGTAAAANFNVLQLGFYAQDEWKISRNFKLNYGVRLDMPMFLTSTPQNNHFNELAIEEFRDAWIAGGAEDPFKDNPSKTGTNIKPSVYFSPRIGFNWDITGEKKHQLRGGVGLFTSRIPYAWPGGTYTNNGITTGSMRIRDAGNPLLNFNPDWNNQPTAGTEPSGIIDLFSENFKFPQVLKTNIGYDVQLPFGIIGIVDAIFTKNLNNVYYQNLSIVPTDNNLTGTGDYRPLYTSIDKEKYPNASKYNNVYLATNTKEGYSYTLSAALEKSFAFGLSLNAAYSFNRALTINDGQSSQNGSQWRTSTIYGANNSTLKTSVYDAGSRVVASASYRINYTKYASTIVSLFYNGSYGDRYGYGYDVFDRNNSGLLGDNVNRNHLMSMYIPKDKNDIHLVDIVKNGNVVATADQQWEALDKFINDDPYLSKNRGQYAEPNSNFTPWQNIFDAKIIQEFKLPLHNGKAHRLQVSFDIYNLGNLLNKNWGRMYTPTAYYNVHQLLTFQGYQAGTTTPTFITTNYNNQTGELNKPYNIDDNTNNLQTSRWQAQIGVKYIF